MFPRLMIAYRHVDISLIGATSAIDEQRRT